MKRRGGVYVEIDDKRFAVVPTGLAGVMMVEKGV